jgi:AraC-like DNA-binding protein
MFVALKPKKIRPDASMRNQNALGAFSFVLHERGARSHFWSGTGCLSIKSFTGCEALYDAGRGLHKVDETSYLVLNSNQDYSISVEDGRHGESFCVFFEDGFAEQVHHSLSRKTAHLLDEPGASSNARIHFFYKTYPHDSVLSPAVRKFKTELALRQEDSEWVNEQLYGVMRRLLSVHQKICREVEQVAGVRASTREELYRRVHRARDFMAASFDQPITLEDVARVACLSPNHLLRSFKQVFRQTPHQFLTTIRLEAATRLLVRTGLSTCDVCLSVGFESLGSFTNLFSRSFGVSPGKYRLLKR